MLLRGRRIACVHVVDENLPFGWMIVQLEPYFSRSHSDGNQTNKNVNHCVVKLNYIIT